MSSSEHAPRERTLELSDSELLSLVHAGTTGAFATLYVRHTDELGERVVRSFPEFSPLQILMVTAEAFLCVLKNLLTNPRTEPERDFLTEASSLAESIASEEPSSHPAGSGRSKSTESKPHHIASSVSESIAESFASLPDHWQRIIWLARVERLPYEIAATHLASDVRRVRRLARRAERDFRAKWKQNLGQQNGGVRTRPAASRKNHRSPVVGAYDDAEESGVLGAHHSDPFSGCGTLVSDLRVALLHAVLCSPALIEQLADTLTQVHARELDGVNTSDAASKKTAGSSAKETGHPVKTHLTDKAAVTTMSPYRSAPTLILAVAGVVAICATLLLLGVKWETFDENTEPTRNTIDEGPTPSHRSTGTAEKETTTSRQTGSS